MKALLMLGFQWGSGTLTWSQIRTSCCSLSENLFLTFGDVPAELENSDFFFPPYQVNFLHIGQRCLPNVAPFLWFHFSSHCQSETVLRASPAAAYIMPAEDCHSSASRGETHMKLSPVDGEGGQFTMLHKQCIPSSWFGWCRWLWAGCREMGCCTDCVYQRRSTQAKAWQRAARVRLWWSVCRVNFTYQRLVCFSYPVCNVPSIIHCVGAHNGHQTILHPRTYQSNALLERWRGNACWLSCRFASSAKCIVTLHGSLGCASLF